MRTLVSAPRCPLYLRPGIHCELSDEALLGWSIDILGEPTPGWYHIQTDYGYTGYAPSHALTQNENCLHRWDALPHRWVRRGICSVRSAPKVQGWQVTQLLRGAIVAIQGEADSEGWQKLLLPDGQEGYTKSGFLSTPPQLTEEPDIRSHIAAAAKSYLGTHYLWGGKTQLGIDCSGLAFMAYRLSGFSIWRDAVLREEYPIHSIDPAARQEGDLLFFPGHVALYLGDDLYIHSTAKNGSDGVVINSLRPGHPDYRPDLSKQLIGAGSLF